jgi:hypothetical protein
MNYPRATGKTWKFEDFEVFAGAICGIQIVALLSLRAEFAQDGDKLAFRDALLGSGRL